MRNRRAFFKVFAGAAAGMYVSQGAGGGGPLTPVQAPPAAPPSEDRRRDAYASSTSMRTGTCRSARSSKARRSRSTHPGPGLDERVPIMDKLGDRRRGDQRQRLLVVRGEGPGPGARHLHRAQRDTRQVDARRIPIASSAMASVPLQFPTAGRRDAAGRDHAARRARRHRRRPRQRRKRDAAEVRPVLGEGRGAGAARVHAPRTAPTTSSSRARSAGRGGLGNIVGNPLETTVFLSRLIFDGTFDKFPALRVCGAHGGGYLPSYLGRTEVACERAEHELRQQADGRANTCGSRSSPTRWCSPKRACGISWPRWASARSCYGTDIPFNWPVTVDLVLNASFLSDADKEAILSGNLMKLLRITS